MPALEHYAQMVREAEAQIAALKDSISTTLREAGFIADAEDDLMCSTLARWAFAKGAEVTW